MMFENAEEIRKALIAQFPNENNDLVSIEESGFVHDSPRIAIGVVLISSIVLGTTDPVKLKQFTGYSERFVRGIANNLENSGLWKNGKYECSNCSQVTSFPPKSLNRRHFASTFGPPRAS